MLSVFLFFKRSLEGVGRRSKSDSDMEKSEKQAIEHTSYDTVGSIVTDRLLFLA